MTTSLEESPQVTELPPAPESPEQPVRAPAPARVNAPVTIVRFLLGLRDLAMERCVPAELERDTEPYRRARLVTGFGFLGFIFGCAYAGFYLLIGHYVGADVIAGCSVVFGVMPFVLRKTGSVRLAANLLTFVLVAGFCALCGIEGGVRGHAIGWLAAAPLCALLLVEGTERGIWCAVCVVATACFVGLDFAGVRVPMVYPERWHEVVTGAGYLGLTLFMSVLGLIFEGGRRRAFGRMERAAAELSEANVQLKKLDVEKNQFLGVVSHDLKNTMNIAMGFAELIAAGRNPTRERDREDARYIVSAADRMLALITQLLDINAIEHGRFPLEIEACDLGAISAQVTTGFNAIAEKKGITIYAAGPIMPARILADQKAVFRILDNLVSNAIKYSPPGRDVFVRVRNTMDGVVWEVQDQGAGLTEEDMAKLYQKFMKLSARPTAGESSTGLGLSIVKMLAEAMKGTVECRSKPGEGATFAVRFPVIEEPVAPVNAAAGVAVEADASAGTQ